MIFPLKRAATSEYETAELTPAYSTQDVTRGYWTLVQFQLR